MSGSTISGYVVSAVSLGSAAYGSPLTITTTGTVRLHDPTYAFGTNYGVFGSGAQLTLVNDGLIHGQSLGGGGGVSLVGGEVLNSGTISSGAGSAGGYGITLAGGTLFNSGTIIGAKERFVDSYVYNAAGGRIYGHVTMDGGLLITAGTISGTSAMVIGNGGTLELLPGAIMIGFAQAGGSGVLALGSSSSTPFDFNTIEYTGFNQLAFAPDAARTVISSFVDAFFGPVAVTGFDTGDQLIFEGYVAQSATLEAGTGIVLDCGTISISGDFGGTTGERLNVDVSGQNTTLSVLPAAIGSVTQLSTIATRPVVLGGLYYGTDLTITNSGSAAPGGSTAASGVSANTLGVTLLNAGQVTGGVGATVAGGYGVSLTGAYISNSGQITGGIGTNSTADSLQSGGAGVNLAGGTVANTGSITGGYGIAGVGGAGLKLEQNVNVTNGAGGVIAGGAGAIGGDGISFYHPFASVPETIINAGTIEGGTGGSFVGAGTLAGGQGGYGISLNSSYVTIINSGVIAGGAGRYGAPGGGGITFSPYSTSTAINTGLIEGGAGSDGVVMYSGVLINAGTISGADAVFIGGYHGTLVVDPGAVFIGAVVAGASVVLALGENSSGSLAASASLDLTGAFENFATIDFASAQPWTVAGGTADLANVQTITGFAAGDALVLTGFAATAGRYMPGTGLVLSNGTASETIRVSGSFGDDTDYALSFSSANGTTAIFAATDVAPPVFTLSTVTNYAAALGGGRYGSSLTITNTGGVEATGKIGRAGISAATLGVSLVNAGTVSGEHGINGYIYSYYRDGPLSTFYSLVSAGENGGDGVSLASAYLSNSGVIIGGYGGAYGGAFGGVGGDGVFLTSSTARNTGIIQGGTTGGFHRQIAINYGPAGSGAALTGGSFYNDGTITGGTGHYGTRWFVVGSVPPGPSAGSDGGYGATVSAGGVLLNAASGLVQGGTGGVGGAGYYRAPTRRFPYSLLVKGGSGGAGGAGALVTGGTLINMGTITGGTGGGGGTSGTAGVLAMAGAEGTGVVISSGVLITDGTISGVDAVSFTGTGTLVVQPDAVFVGAVVADAGAGDVLELDGTTSGTLNLDGSFENFGTVDFAPGQPWTLLGSAAALESLTAITGLTLGDTIGIFGFSVSSETYVPGTGLELSDGTTSITLAVEGGLNGAAIADATAPCFCVGTRIRTPGGQVAVEDLRIGDLVETAFSGPQRIKWIGRRDYEGRFIAGNHLALPVCLKAGAIAEGIPGRDLWVSPDHAICEGGVLIPAWRLVNGVSIVQAEAVDAVRYFHLEFEAHQVIFAENCAAESFVDADCRARFQNADEYIRLYGEAGGAGRPCLPRLQGGFHLHNIQRRIAARAGVVPQILPPGRLRGNLDEAGPERLHGWAQDEASPEEPVMLDVFAGGIYLGRVLANEYRSDLRAAGLGSGCHAFTLPLIQGFDGGLDIRRVADGAVLYLPEAVRAA